MKPLTMKTTIEALKRFFETPSDPMPLGIFRILISGFALLQAVVWYPDWLAFFGKEGWIQWEISRALAQNWSIHIEQVYFVLHKYFGANETQTAYTLFWVYFISAFGLFMGILTRFWGFMTWFAHYIILISAPTFTYGVDIFLHIGLFYLMVMPVNKALSLDVRLGWASPEPSWGVTLSLRVLQIHMSLAYVSAGVEKMFAPDWWNGNVLWRAVVQPDFRQFNLFWLADYPFITMFASWFTMIAETFYCVGMWIPRVRIFWLMAMTALHLGIGLFLGLWFFGLVMILLSFSAFGYDAYLDIKAWRQQR